MLATLDWIIIILFTTLILGVGISYTNSAGKSLTDYFLGGRKLPWYIAGVSMVATTFAADTPLAVTELVAKNGISGNWLWWNMLAGGLLTTFFFAHLWRRANILTEAEFIELRYSGFPAAFLRGFRAIYLGLIMNALVIGWVNLALMSLLEGFFAIPANETIYYCAGAMSIVAVYASLSGLKGVAITDAIQFTIAMFGCIVLAYFVVSSPEIGGLSELVNKTPDWSRSFFPSIGGVSEAGEVLAIGTGTFLAFAGFSWWSSWYPGAEPGGGGYIAQRMMSAKTEKDAVYATLFFQVAHYCIRPWPWIIVALCAMVIYPNLEDPKLGFVYAMRDYLPAGFKGLLLVAFFGAYMSTISTQLNWGSSYLVNDFYKRFLSKSNENESDKKYVIVGRVCTFILMLFGLFATTKMDSISAVWQFILECSAGLGLVLILRWYWWRINAWSEISATIGAFAVYGICKFLGFYVPYFKDIMVFPNTFFIVIFVTTLIWLVVTYLTQPTEHNHLQAFYERIKPQGNWHPQAQISNTKPNNEQLFYALICWLLAIVLVYSMLFIIGYILFANWQSVMYCGIAILIASIGLRVYLPKSGIV